MNNRRISIYLSLIVCILLSSAMTAGAKGPAQPGNSTIIKGLVSSALNGETRTLLPDGRSLVLGGQDDAGQPRSDAFIQDSDTGTMTALASSMNYARAGHTATVLPDGKVLVLGGIGADATVVAQSELFDPQSGIFQPITSGAPEPRAFHTATLLTDGRVWIAGGVSASGQILQSTQLWDPRQKTTVKTRIKLSQGRRSHAAALLPDGRVLIWGGKESLDAAMNNGEIFDPVAQTVTVVDNPQAALPEDTAIAELRASSPEDNASDVPVDTFISMRFSDPLLMKSLNTQTVLLQGPEGVVNAAIVGAEAGMLAFRTPKAPLVPGTTYSVTFSGGTDVKGATVAFTQFTFTTAGELPLDDQWVPSGDWMTHRPDSKWQALPPLHAPAGVTALAGQVLKLDGNPLARVTLIIDGQPSLTDGTGRFLLKNISAGHHAMKINATTANSRTRAYGIYEVGVDIKGGQTNVLGYTIWMTPLDTAHTVTISSPTLTETVITTPLLPGLELHIPANTVITGDNGRVVTQINITPIPLDRPPFPLPKVQVPIYFTIQPGSSYIKVMASEGPKGASLFYPNSFHYAPGTQFNFWNYDPDNKGWFVYGQGRVSADASKVIPNPGVVLYEFTGAMVANPGDAPPVGPPPGDNTGTGGDPVNLSTGLFVYTKTDLVVPDVIPLSLSRSYRPSDSVSRSFGVGTSQPYDIFLVGTNNTNPGGGYIWEDLILPDGGKIHFDRISPCTGANGYCDFSDAIFEHTSSPTDYYGATIKWTGVGSTPWTLTKKDGTMYFFPDSDGSTSARNGALFGMQDRFGNVVQFTRDFNTLNLVQVTSPNGRWIKFTYDTANRITQAQDNIGRIVQYAYDAGGRLSQVTDANGGITKYAYDAFAEMLNIQDARGVFYLTNQYDSGGRIVKQTMADGGVYQFAYTTDPNTGAIAQTDLTDPRGFVKRTTFNSHGYTTSVVLALGRPEQQTTIYVRDPNTNLISTMIDALQHETSYTYDPLGNVLSVTTMDGTSAAAPVHYTYDPNFSQVASITDALNHTTTYQRDPSNGNLAAIIDALGNQTTYSYYANGQLQSVTDPMQKTVQFTYDHSDVSSITDRLSNVTNTFTDGAGRTVTRTDALGNRTQFVYNSRNQVTQITDPKGGITSFTYDLNGNLLTTADALNHVTSYTYDNMDRVLTRTDPLLRQQSSLYDLAGNMSTHTDQKGQVTSFTYDALNRLQFVGYNTVVNGGTTSYDSTITYTYDPGGRITQLLDSASGTITKTYDDLNLISTETTAQGTLTHAYDAAGRPATFTVGGQSPINYSYDNANRLTLMVQGASTIGFTYDNASRRSSLTLPNGINIAYSYDDASHLTSLSYYFGMNLLGTVTYAYDRLGRKSQMGGSFGRTLLPSAVTSAAYDVANELTNWNGLALSYDTNGNMLSDGVNSFAWNARNQVVSLNGVGLQYDALNRRTKNAAGTSFLYDGSNAVQELSGTTVMANLVAGGVDEIFYRADSSGTSTALRDDLGSMIALVNSTGSINTSYAYDPFGSTSASGQSNANTLQYAGRENEGNGLYFYRGRYYQSQLGRFISQDPAGSLGSGMNLYAYVDDNPVNFNDPFGLSKQPPADQPPVDPPTTPKKKLKKGDPFPMDLQACVASYGYKALHEGFELGAENDREMAMTTGESLSKMFLFHQIFNFFEGPVALETGLPIIGGVAKRASPWALATETTLMFGDLALVGVKSGWKQDEIQAEFEVGKQLCLNDLNYEIVE
jgi:RHS repeat-associated protein